MLDIVREHLSGRASSDLPGLVRAGSAKAVRSAADPTVRTLGLFLDEVWFSGGVAADAPPDVLTSVYADLPDTALARAVEITARAAGWRFLVIGSTRVDPARGAEASRRMVSDLHRWLERCPDAGLVAHGLLIAADLLRLGGLPQPAGEYLQEAFDQFTALGDEVGRGRCHLIVADSFLTPWSSPELAGLDPWDLGREAHAVNAETAQLALSACAEADAAFTAADAPRGRAAVAIRKAYLALLGGEFDNAREHARQARGHVAESGDVAYGHLATTFELLAAIALGEAGELRLHFPRDVIAWARERGSASYARALSRLTRGVGARWLRAGAPEEARLACTLATEVADGLGHADEEAACLGALAELYGAVNNRGPAIGTLHRAFKRYTSADGENAEEWMQAAAMLSALEAQYVAERHADGQAWCGARAAQLLDRAPVPPTRTDEDLFVAARRRYTALPEQGKRRVTADGRAQDAGFTEDMMASISDSLLDAVELAAVRSPLAQALTHRRDGLDELADAKFAEALAAAETLGRRGRSLRVLALIGDRRFDEAADAVTELRATIDYPDDLATDLLVAAHQYDATAPPDVQAEPGVGSLWRQVLTPAEIRLRTGDIQGAAEQLAAGRADFEHWFAGLRRDPFRISVTDDINARSLYLLAAEAAIKLGDPEASLALSDRLRSLPLLCLLDETPGPWAQANATWSAAFDLVAWAGTQPVIRTMSSDPALALIADRTPDELLDQVQLELEAVPPALLGPRGLGSAEVAGTGAELLTPLDVAALRRGLPPGALLLTFLMAGDRLITWAVGAAVLETRVQETDTDRLSGHAKRLHDACAGVWVPGDAEKSRMQLGRLLLDPVAELLRRHRRVLVAPSGALHLLPFAVLPFDGDVLGASHVLSVLPAAALLTVDRPRPAGDVLVVGDPGSAGLRRLPGTAVEAELVAKRYGTHPLTGDAATADAVSNRLADARIVHMATHGLLSEIAPTASALALHASDRLDVAKIAGLRLDAELVVLSACDTGRGDTTIGGDVVGLARQLLAAGARKVVVSLWPVDDVTTCVFMDEFHRVYEAQRDAAMALAEAQRTIRALSSAQVRERFGALTNDETSGPAARGRRRGLIGGSTRWAGFVVIGT